MSSPADWDVLVVGAGPAGLAAAEAAAAAGARVAVVDRGARPGGQYWRHGPAGATPGLQHHWPEFARLRDAVTARGARLLAEHHVQTLLPDPAGWRLRCVVGAEPRRSDTVADLRARALVLATGAYDRQLPFPGWELPGVLSAGGVQALLKEHGVLAGQRVVVAGTGPFLLPVAAGLLRGGARVPVVAEANSPVALAGRPRALAGAAGKAVEAAGYAAALARGRVRYRRRLAVVRALGDDRLAAVELARLDGAGRVRPGTTRRVTCDALAIGWGFTPQLELALQAGCATRVDTDGSLVVTVDGAQATSVPGVWAAGEATGVGGWELAALEGAIAGAAATGSAPDARRQRRRAALRRFAAALHAAHPVPAFLLDDVSDDVPACRCEEVPVGAVREAVRDFGATDARTVKLLTRTGMGWCQGRICGYATARLTAHACGRDASEADLRAMAERPLAAPSTLRTLAGD